MMYVVTGATGNTGKVVAENLLAAGKEVRVISRSADRLEALKEKGAEPLVGNLEDAHFVKEAFNGAEGVYAMIPPKFDANDFRGYQKLVANNFVDAVKVNQVPYVVSLSSYGAHLENGAGVVSGLYPFEQSLNALEGVHVVHLRAGYFLENFYGSIPVIKGQNVLGGFPIAGDTKLNMVFTADIGKVAADKLVAKDFTGKNVVFLSHENAHTLNEATGVLGKAIDKPELSYVAFPPEGAKQAMMGMGFSESLAENYLEFSKAAGEGKLSGDSDNHPVIHTPTSLEDFSTIFAQVYQQ